MYLKRIHQSTPPTPPQGPGVGGEALEKGGGRVSLLDSAASGGRGSFLDCAGLGWWGKGVFLGFPWSLSLYIFLHPLSLSLSLSLHIHTHMYIYMLDFCNLDTNVANGSIRIFTLDLTSRIYIQILVICVPMLQMDRSLFSARPDIQL
jgi:hypothetical protein